jgi:hypothetical protein
VRDDFRLHGALWAVRLPHLDAHGRVAIVGGESQAHDVALCGVVIPGGVKPFRKPIPAARENGPCGVIVKA